MSETLYPALATIDQGGLPSWHPHDPSVQRDQRAAYDQMRQGCPVAHSDALGWSIFGHRDVSLVVDDPIAFSSATRRMAIPNGMDPPDHTAYRVALESLFTSDRLARFEATSRRIADDLLAPMVERDVVEAIRDFVDPFAHQALCAFMGWPFADWNQISDWTHGNLDAAFRGDREAGARLAREFSAYVVEILQARRAEPTSGDLMSELVGVTVRDEALSDEQIVSLLRTWTAGHGTVAAALGNIVRCLAEDVDLQASLRARPDLVEPAIWEILRVDGPLVANARTTTREVVIGGQPIPAGERISLTWISANRDAATFDDPERVILDRGHDQNLLFGAGIHRCLGESLALMNLRTAVLALLQSTSGFGSSESDTPVRQTYPSNGLRKLPLRLRPAASIASAP